MKFQKTEIREGIRQVLGRISNTLCMVLILAGVGVVLYPVVMAISGSIKSGNELYNSLGAVLNGGAGELKWHLFPQFPTLEHFYELLFETPAFFTVFWNSVGMVGAVLTGQLVVAVPAAWAFARFSFRGKKWLFLMYVILMLMPFQVLMLPDYLVLKQFGLIGSPLSVILPAIFSTFPVFLIYRGFTSIPEEILEAAKTDGAGSWTLFIRMGVPLGSAGILSALVLGFLEYWNMIEQPLAFLTDQTTWPLSLYLPEIGTGQAGAALAASVITLLPAAFVFFMGQDYLEQGIIASGMKE